MPRAVSDYILLECPRGVPVDLLQGFLDCNSVVVADGGDHDGDSALLRGELKAAAGRRVSGKSGGCSGRPHVSAIRAPCTRCAPHETVRTFMSTLSWCIRSGLLVIPACLL